MAKLTKLKTKKRLTPSDREQEIIDEAVQFFAEVGFGGRTRDLAKRIGITQPLLYRYFPTKDDLIERVFKEVYLNWIKPCLLYTSPSPRDATLSRMPSSA